MISTFVFDGKQIFDAKKIVQLPKNILNLHFNLNFHQFPPFKIRPKSLVPLH